METYIKYQRFIKRIYETQVQDFFDELIKNGYSILYYGEQKVPQYNEDKGTNGEFLEIIVVCGKLATQIKNVL